MKKLIALLTIAGMLMIGFTNQVTAQDVVPEVGVDTTEQVAAAAELDEAPATLAPPSTEGKTFHQILKEKFIEGSPAFMGIVLLVLIFGLALSIERIIYLNLSTTNTQKLLNNVESALDTGGVNAAKEICKNTRGPVASIFYQGLDRYEKV
jgi:biopolymer transport protein ExbB